MSGAGLENWPRCRLARADITPEGALPLAGYAKRHGPSEGVASALEANALLTAIDGAPLLIVALDTLFGSRALREGLARRLAPSLPGLGAARVQLIASHTHYAPSLDPAKPRLGVADEGYLAFCVERVAEAIETAIARPASTVRACRVGRARCEANVYRRLLTWVREPRSLRFRRRVVTAPNPDVVVDHELRVAHLVGADSETLGLIWSWPCHAVSLGDVRTVSADFPGAVRERLRGRHGARVPVLYLPGFSGDLRPRPGRRHRSLRGILAMPFARGFDRPDAASHAQLCESVGAAALAADDAAGEASERASDERGSSLVNTGLPLERLLDGYAGEERLERTAIALPPLRFVLLGAEVCGGHADAVAGVDFASGCANAVYGYLPTASQVVEGGYEVEGFVALFSLKGRYRADIDGPVRALIGGNGGNGEGGDDGNDGGGAASTLSGSITESSDAGGAG